MNDADAIAWLRELILTNVQRDDDGYYDEGRATAWLAEAHSALSAMLPPNHPLLKRWEAVDEGVKAQRTLIPAGIALDPSRGIVTAALSMLEGGRLGSIMEAVRADTVIELLDQAKALLPRHVVAAAVIAGGALETHLLHLCTRNGIVLAGEGSIGKYDGAIAQARNAGTVEVYSLNDSKQNRLGAASEMRRHTIQRGSPRVRTA